MSHDEQSLDAATWRHLEKRYRECTHVEITYVIAELNQQATEEGLRAAALQARIDQCDAMIADCIRQLERWANGGAP